MQMKRQWVLQGKVARGSKAAAHFTQLGWVQQQCKEKLDFAPFPGTLNIDIHQDYFPLLGEMHEADAIELIPPGGEGCAGKVLPLYIEGIKAAIVIPECKTNIHGHHIVEVMAPVGLRDSLGLADGHRVTLFVDRPGNTFLDAVIFDLDGTLLDSVGVYFSIVKSTLDRLGYPQVSMAVLREAVKDGGFEWASVLPKSTDINKSGLLAQIQSVAAEVYRPMFENEAKPIPGMKDALVDLAAAGIKLGIVTSTPRENVDFKLKKLRQNGTLCHFMAIVTATDVARKKPAPDPMIECCRQLDVKLQNSVYVGDSRSDIKSGKSAGMKTIAVLSGFDDLRALSKEFPDAVINSVAELNMFIN